MGIKRQSRSCDALRCRHVPWHYLCLPLIPNAKLTLTLYKATDQHKTAKQQKPYSIGRFDSKELVRAITRTKDVAEGPAVSHVS